MRLARGDDPVEFLSPASRSVKRLLRGPRTERDFILVFGGVSKRFDSSAKAEFPGRHAEGPVNFLGKNCARADGRARTGNDNGDWYGVAPGVGEVRVDRWTLGSSLLENLINAFERRSAVCEKRTQFIQAARGFQCAKKTDPAHGVENACFNEILSGIREG